MPKKTILAKYKGRELKAVNTWFSGAKLMIDGVCQAKNTDMVLVNSKKPALSTTIDIDGEPTLIEVFMEALLTVKMKIFVNNELVAGDDF